jgi:hypothetical protein
MVGPRRYAGARQNRTYLVNFARGGWLYVGLTSRSPNTQTRVPAGGTQDLLVPGAGFGRESVYQRRGGSSEKDYGS